ncbi:MAG: tetratricopeptide repeat protein [Planctomycetaceae bacterium]|nr:tetratricopeptide repeat protein [Planctomycetales bacterium]MCB9923043.1 tetratricopeptide repeat protein [Planctomycetaceae bacterium]
MRLIVVGLWLLLFGGWVTYSPGQEAAAPAKQDPTTKVDPDLQRVAQRDLLWAEALQQSSDGEYAVAIAKGEETLSLEYALFGEKSEELTGTLKWLTSQYLKMQQFEQATDRAKKYRTICNAIYGEKSWQSVSAKFFEDNILRLSMVQPERLEIILKMEVESAKLIDEQKHLEAIGKMKKLLDEEREILGEDHPYYANTLWNIAAEYEMVGRYTNAERYLTRARNIIREHLHVGDPYVRNVAWALGRIRILTQLHESAIEPLREARRLFLAAGQKADAGYMASRLGEAYFAAGQANDAVIAYEQAILEFRQASDRHAEAVSLVHLASLHRELDDYARAEPLYQRALEILVHHRF